jgi:hypothetical protein
MPFLLRRAENSVLRIMTLWEIRRFNPQKVPTVGGHGHWEKGGSVTRVFV